jgi:tetratricopeptide (TPR) repeat protein
MRHFARIMHGNAETPTRRRLGQSFCLSAMRHSNFSSNTLACRRPLTAPILVLLVFGLAANMHAQNSSGPADPQVQQLYAEAKAAQAQGDLAGAAAKYENLLQVAPKLGPAYNNLGALYLQQREYRKAAAILEKGLKVDPRMTSASVLWGIALYEMGDYTTARGHLESGLRANPKDDNAELFLCNDLIKLGDFEGAAGHLRQLSQRQPQNQELWYLLGKVHMKLSEQALSKLNAIDPDSVYAHEISGEVMEGMKNFDGALLEYKKAVQLAPRQPGTHYMLGNAYWVIQMWEAAAEQFRAELVNDPANCAAQWKLGNIVLEQRADPTEALAQIEKALSICPSLAEARLDRGRALMRLERNEEAIRDLQAAEKSDPSEPNTHFLLAQALRAAGKAREAQAEMQVFSKLEENARAKIADRAKQLLQEKEKSP